MTGRALAAILATALLTFETAEAAPISYTTLSNGVAAFGSVPSDGVNNDPEDATYFRFLANAGDAVTVTGTRQENDYDMAFWLFEGLFGDTAEFGLTFENTDPGFIDVGDDEIPNLGPFGDPQSNFVAANSGFYTVAVVNFASGPNDGGDGRFDFQIVASNIQNVDVPEPGMVALFGLSALALGGMARRRR